MAGKDPLKMMTALVPRESERNRQLVGHLPGQPQAVAALAGPAVGEVSGRRHLPRGRAAPSSSTRHIVRRRGPISAAAPIPRRA